MAESTAYKSPSITKDTICDLLRTFSLQTYSNETVPSNNNSHLDQVISLMERDYIIYKISNEDKCSHYPSTIPIMVSFRFEPNTDKNKENVLCSIDEKVLEDLMDKAKFARCRQRFPVPVIMLDNKYVCRSATVSSVPEICYRLLTTSKVNLYSTISEYLWPGIQTCVNQYLSDNSANLQEQSVPPFCDNIRNADVTLLKEVKVTAIFDIMVEKRKIKHNLYVSDSEKVDPQRYSDFTLMSLPFPGCEFFKQFCDNMFESNGLMYDWSNPLNDSELNIPTDYGLKEKLEINWQDYKAWNLTQMTQNYLKYILQYLQESKGGILIHCISGWDRTPLFISLIRLSLWADGLIHTNLDVQEITYLTLAYDWYLFGHNLYDRIAKGEEIMTFCFDFLRYIEGEEFSVKSTESQKYQKYESIAKNINNEAISETAKGLDVAEQDESDKIMCLDNDNREKSNSETSTLTGHSIDVIIDDSEGLRVVSEEYEVFESSNSANTAINLEDPDAIHNWIMINECLDIEDNNIKDNNIESKLTSRCMKLRAVRKLFLSSYQVTVKNEAFGPKTNSTYSEDVADYLSKLWSLFKGYDPEAGGDVKQTTSKEPNEVIDNGNHTQSTNSEAAEDTADISFSALEPIVIIEECSDDDNNMVIININK